MDIKRIDEVASLIDSIYLCRQNVTRWELEKYDDRLKEYFSSEQEFEGVKQRRVNDFKRQLSELESKFEAL